MIPDSGKPQGYPGWLQPIARSARVPLGLVSLLGFLAAFCVQLATVFGIDVEAAQPKVWLLHYGLFPVVLLFIVVVSWMMQSQRRFRYLITHVPMLARIIIIAALLYAAANFVLMMPMTGAGAPIVMDGKFFFNNHGVVSEVTEAQFHAQQSLLLRAYSGHWLFLYLVPAIVLLFWKEHKALDTRRPAS